MISGGMQLTRLGISPLLWMTEMALLTLAAAAASSWPGPGYALASGLVAVAVILWLRHRRGSIMLNRDTLTVTTWLSTRHVDLTRTTDVRIEGSRSDVELVAAWESGWVRVPLLVSLESFRSFRALPPADLDALADVVQRNPSVMHDASGGSRVRRLSVWAFIGWVVTGPPLLALLRDQSAHLAAGGPAQESPMWRWTTAPYPPGSP